MSTGTLLTLWTVRLSCLLYVLAIAQLLTGKRWRIAWTAGFLAYLAHVVAAFAYFHGWSHEAAYRETARQTAELFGFRFGGGLYFNYAFTAIWGCDVIWSWREAAYRSRPAWITGAVHGFLAFMFFNATVVFASGWTRWTGAAATAALAILWWRRRVTRAFSGIA